MDYTNLQWLQTSDLPSYVLDGLFGSFGEEIISDDDDIRN